VPLAEDGIPEDLRSRSLVGHTADTEQHSRQVMLLQNQARMKSSCVRQVAFGKSHRRGRLAVHSTTRCEDIDIEDSDACRSRQVLMCHADMIGLTLPDKVDKRASLSEASDRATASQPDASIFVIDMFNASERRMCFHTLL